MRLPLALAGFLTFSAAHAYAAGRPMTVDDLLKVQTVSDPQVSPDGKGVVYVVSTVDREANRSKSALWYVPVSGGEPRQLTSAGNRNDHPRWSPDGKTIAFVSDRSGSSQIWLLPFAEGGEARQLTSLPIDAAGPVWSPKGDKIAFTAEVYPRTSPDDTARLDKDKAASKTSARTYDHLMIRHWMSWDEGKRSHLFTVDVPSGEVRDLIPSWRANVPPKPFGGSEEYSWSPDGSELAFTSEPLRDRAWSTNTDIWVVPAEGGEPRNRTAANRAADAQPSYAPDGKGLAYVSQARAGFESDQWVLRLANPKGEGPGKDLTSRIDRPVLGHAWSKSGELYAVIDDRGTEPIVRVDTRGADRPEGRNLTSEDFARPIVTGGVSGVPRPTPDGAYLIFTRHDATRPPEVYRAKADGSEPTPITHHNDALIAELDLPRPESFTYRGADGDTVQAFLFRPAGFDEKAKYPVAFLIHGGPQGAYHDEWHSRWNYQMFTSAGYAVVAPNPRGSTGFGQAFTDQISGDWSGRVYEDLMLGLDHALKTYPFLDRERIAALGGSYGGYMVNWIAGHTDRFRCLVSHAGVYDLASKYGTTEELWFPEWEFGGPPWEKPDIYREMSPSESAYRFKTPTLVVHGALDFRVSDGQGLMMFTALQRRGVPSRLVYFPDEGHWITKPGNRVKWWEEVLGWLDKYAKPATAPSS